MLNVSLKVKVKRRRRRRRRSRKPVASYPCTLLSRCQLKAQMI
nr:hypothetical protein [Candidatus Cardinium sp. cBcalN1]